MQTASGSRQSVLHRASPENRERDLGLGGVRALPIFLIFLSPSPDFLSFSGTRSAWIVALRFLWSLLDMRWNRKIDHDRDGRGGSVELAGSLTLAMYMGEPLSNAMGAIIRLSYTVLCDSLSAPGYLMIQ